MVERQGPAREVLKVGVMADPIPGSGEVRIRIAASGINPGDIKKRQNAASPNLRSSAHSLNQTDTKQNSDSGDGRPGQGLLRGLSEAMGHGGYHPLERKRS